MFPFNQHIVIYYKDNSFKENIRARLLKDLLRDNEHIKVTEDCISLPKCSIQILKYNTSNLCGQRFHKVFVQYEAAIEEEDELLESCLIGLCHSYGTINKIDNGFIINCYEDLINPSLSIAEYLRIKNHYSLLPL